MYTKQNNIHLILRISFIGLLFFSLGSCQNNDTPFIEASINGNLKETRLGESNYYLFLPENFEISEARGKEGQLGYDIIPHDTSSSMSGFVEIEPGNPIRGEETDEGLKGFLSSIFLNKKTIWKLCQTETKYFEANTQRGDISVSVISKNRNEIDSLIAIIATLTKK